MSDDQDDLTVGEPGGIQNQGAGGGGGPGAGDIHGVGGERTGGPGTAGSTGADDLRPHQDTELPGKGVTKPRQPSQPDDRSAGPGSTDVGHGGRGDTMVDQETSDAAANSGTQGVPPGDVGAGGDQDVGVGGGGGHPSTDLASSTQPPSAEVRTEP